MALWRDSSPQLHKIYDTVEKMGLHKSVISRIEQGKYHNDLSLATLLKIAEKLQIDPSLFLSFNDLEKKLWWEPLPEENDDSYEEEEK